MVGFLGVPGPTIGLIRSPPEDLEDCTSDLPRRFFAVYLALPWDSLYGFLFYGVSYDLI